MHNVPVIFRICSIHTLHQNANQFCCWRSRMKFKKTVAPQSNFINFHFLFTSLWYTCTISPALLRLFAVFVRWKMHSNSQREMLSDFLSFFSAFLFIVFVMACRMCARAHAIALPLNTHLWWMDSNPSCWHFLVYYWCFSCSAAVCWTQANFKSFPFHKYLFLNAKRIV